MAKVVDITDKLSFEENPTIKIKDTVINVNSDAATMLKIMGVLADNENAGPKEIMKMYSLLFSNAEQKKIEALKLNFKDFRLMIEAAINLVTGEGEQGE